MSQTRDVRRPSGRIARRLIRAALVLILALAALAAAGAIYESVAAAGDDARFPMRGRLVDIGGYRLHLDCRGSGSPAIILDAGLGSSSLDWTLVQDRLSATTTVCSYDRAGMGWSDPGPAPRSPGQIAGELARLLSAAAIPGPYVLAGHSLAGKNIRMFALQHPELVAGMVLVDARSEAVDAQATPAEQQGFASALDAQGRLFWLAGRLGLARLLGGQLLIGEPKLSDTVATEMAVLETRPNAIAATTAEGLLRTADDASLAGASLGDLPLAVISAGNSLASIPHWQEGQDSMARLSTRSRVVVAEGSGHAVHLEQPEIVVEAIENVLADARTP